MVTGSVVSSLQGEPRSTHDIDLVVLLKSTDVKKLADGFPSPDFYLNINSIEEAIRFKTMFNLIDLQSGTKIDFWLLTNEPFDQARFERKKEITFMGIAFFITSPEDTIISKLRWSKMAGGSQKQRTDVMRVFQLQKDLLDRIYMNRWLKELALEDEWNSVFDK